MECFKCGGEMIREEMLVDTAKADLDDSFEAVWTCEDCGHEYIKGN